MGGCASICARYLPLPFQPRRSSPSMPPSRTSSQELRWKLEPDKDNKSQIIIGRNKPCFRLLHSCKPEGHKPERCPWTSSRQPFLRPHTSERWPPRFVHLFQTHRRGGWGSTVPSSHAELPVCHPETRWWYWWPRTRRRTGTRPRRNDSPYIFSWWRCSTPWRLCLFVMRWDTI